MPQKSASKIYVKDSDVTLLWPLLIEPPQTSETNPNRPDIEQWSRLLQGKDGKTTTEKRTLREFNVADKDAVSDESSGPEQYGLWTDAKRCYPDCKKPDHRTEYAENVYFHSFARQFLYCNDSSVILEKCALSGQQLEFRWHQSEVVKAPGGKEETLFDGAKAQLAMRWTIRQVQLHLFENRVAMLAIKLYEPLVVADNGAAVERTPSLAEIQKCLNEARNVYAPYFQPRKYRATAGEESTGSVVPAAGLCPDEVRLLLANRDAESGANKLSVTAFKTIFSGAETCKFHMEVLEGKDRQSQSTVEEPPTANWLKGMLYPLTCPDHETELVKMGTDSGWLTRHKGCGLTFRHLVDHRIPIHVWLALDNPRYLGTADWMRLAWVENPGSDEVYPYAPPQSESQFAANCLDRFWHATGSPPGNVEHTTRWLVSGYSFMGVGADSGFFNHVIRGHVRHHYFRLVMHAHFLKASLLSFEAQIAAALNDLSENNEDAMRRDNFEERLNAIQMSMVRFRSRYWFSEITNQMQGQELFEMLKHHLNLLPLFEEAFGEMKDATDIVLQWNQEQAARAASRLAVVATVFLVAVPSVEVLWSWCKFTEANRILWVWPIFVALGVGSMVFSGWLMRFGNSLARVNSNGTNGKRKFPGLSGSMKDGLRSVTDTSALGIVLAASAIAFGLAWIVKQLLTQ